ncbi:hypothetical protein J6590_047964 [Homalodisca vitripennis]|nr:hypothetical protein J6590_047964 [Homalodisca vitripennis]
MAHIEFLSEYPRQTLNKRQHSIGPIPHIFRYSDEGCDLGRVEARGETINIDTIPVINHDQSSGLVTINDQQFHHSVVLDDPRPERYNCRISSGQVWVAL